MKTPEKANVEEIQRAIAEPAVVDFDEDSFLASLTPAQQRQLAAVRAADAQKLAEERTAQDERIAQRVAQILAGRVSVAQPEIRPGVNVRVVRHPMLICDQTGDTFPADHPDPYGAMRKRGMRNVTFSGHGSFHENLKLDKESIGSQAIYTPDLHGEFPAKEDLAA